MPIDSGIYAQIQQPKVDNPLNALAQVAQLQHYQSQNMLSGLKADEYQRGVAEENALRQAYASNADPKARLDALAKVSPKGYQAEAKFQIDQQKSQRDSDKSRLELVKQNVDMQGQLLGGVKDEASWQQALQAAQNAGMDTSKFPQQYDPNFVTSARIRALTAAQQVEQEWKQKGYDLDVRKTDETQRHNKATEGLTLSGQNKVDARSREANNAPEYKQDADGNWVALPKKPGAGPITAQAVMGPDGKPLKANKQPNEYQGKSAGYGARAEQADKIITSLEGNYSPMAINSKVSVESTPLVGGMLGAATNKFALNANDQRAEQAQRDFINAVLRQESGASISPSEFDNARKQYFPQPGDTKEVLTQKAQNRKLAIHGFKNSAGNASFSAPAENAPATAKFLGFE